MSKLTKIERNALKDVQSILTKKYKDKLVLLKLFGSKARGDGLQFSDIDLLAVVEKDSWKASEEMSEDVFDIIEKYEYQLLISLMVIDHKEYLTEEKIRTCFYENIKKEGIDLWARN